MNESLHAKCRMQKRGVPPLIIQWLEAFGEEHHDHHGSVILHFSKKSRRRLERKFGSAPIRRLAEWMDSYAVIGSDGLLITVGKRWKRIVN